MRAEMVRTPTVMLRTGVDDGGQNEIGERTSENNGCALPDRLVVERSRLHFGRAARQGPRLARGIGIVEKLDVAAERDGGNAPVGAVAVVEAPQLAAESDGEGGDGHAAPAGDEEVAEFMEEHHHAEHEQEREHEHG